MRFDVTVCGPLSGEAVLPGDSRLTLSVMAFSVSCPHTVTLVNPSPDPDVGHFRDYLEAIGAASFSDTPDGFFMTGKGWPREVCIDDEVPRHIAHIVASAAVFSGKTVVFRAEHEMETAVMSSIVDRISTLGVRKSDISHSDGAVTIGASSFDNTREVQASSAWSFEMIAAGAMAAGKPVSVSYVSQMVSHAATLVSMLGFGSGNIQSEDRNAELTRRMARLSGEPVPDIRRLAPINVAPPVLSIPGDTLIASALAASAAIIQKSDIRLSNVLYEPGRRGFFDSLRRMKGNVGINQTKRRHSFDSADISIGWSALEGIHVTASQARTFIQELPLLGALAAFAQGETVLSDADDGPGAGREAFVALADVLEMLGAYVGDYTDGIIVRGGRELRGNLVDSCGDPSVALACAVVGLNASGSTTVFGFDDSSWPVSEYLSLVKGLKSLI